MGSPGDDAGRCPVKLPDEAALRRRLHEEIDLAEVGPAPVEALFRRRRAVRARRLSAIASGLAVIAVAAGVLVLRTPGGARQGGAEGGRQAPGELEEHPEPALPRSSN